MNKSILQSHPGEVASAIANHRYEMSDQGIYLSDSKVFLGGALKCIDYQDHSEQLCEIDANTLTTEGLIHALNSVFPPTGGYAQIPNWYIAPFSGNYTPTAGLTAATFPATATEFTAYTLGTRLPLVIATAAVAASTGNTGAPAQMTFSTGGPYNIYGAAIVTASAKSATTGKCMAAVRLANPRLAMAAADILGFEYVITAADAG